MNFWKSSKGGGRGGGHFQSKIYTGDFGPIYIIFGTWGAGVIGRLELFRYRYRDSSLNKRQKQEAFFCRISISCFCFYFQGEEAREKFVARKLKGRTWKRESNKCKTCVNSDIEKPFQKVFQIDLLFGTIFFCQRTFHKVVSEHLKI